MPNAALSRSVACLPLILLAVSCELPGPNPPVGATWQTVFEQLPSGLLAVSGTGPESVYVVGTDVGDGNGPMFAHYDGEAWHRLNTGTTGDLWWICAAPIDGAFYLSGENGTIIRFDPQTRTVEPQVTPGTQTIFGIWGSASDNIWAVGGLLDNQQFGGTIWHFDGATWSEHDLSALFPGGYATVLKVWGRSQDEVYAVGAAGLILRFDGSEWTQVDNGTATNPPFFSVYGNADTVVVVGGFNAGFILEGSNSGFSNLADPGTIQMNGVFLSEDGWGAAVGRELGVAFRTASGWEVQDTSLPVNLDFHANWIDSEGGIWAVGGNLISDPIDQGVLVYYGSRSISSDFSVP